MFTIGLIGISFVIAFIVIWARSWLGFLIVWAAAFLATFHNTDSNAPLAIMAATASCVTLYIAAHWVHNKFGAG